MAAWQEYLELLGGLGATLEKLTAIERRKTEAAGRGDLLGVEDCMKQEQAMSLSLRSLDRKRETMLAALGLSGQPLSDLQRHSPPEYELETKRAVEELQRQYGLFRASSEVARNTLECNLRAIERLLPPEEEGRPPEEPRRQADFRI